MVVSATDLLRICVQTLRSLTGAARVSFYLPADSGVSHRALLIHDNGEPAVPELAGEEKAREFARRAARRMEVETDLSRPLFLQQLDSESPDGRLIRISSPDSMPALLYRMAHRGQAPPARRRTDVPGADPTFSKAMWLGLAAEGPRSSGAPPWVRLERDVSWLPALASTFAWHERKMATLLRDPISGLYGRAHFQTLLRDAVVQAQLEQAPLAVLLIHPDDFAVVNETFGSEAGDTVVREIARRLETTMRSKDLVARYSGVIFGVGLQGVATAVGEVVAQKAQRKLTEAPYRRGSVRLGFSIGLAEYEPMVGDDPSESALELVRRADRALNVAKEAGGNRIVSWERELEPRSMGTLDRLTGIFTANLAKDYRNMLVLWDTVIVVSNTSDFDALVSKLVERLHGSFKADRVGLFDWSESGELRLIHGKAREIRGEPESLGLSDDQQALLADARALGLAGQTGLMYAEADGTSFCCVPLIARDQCLGALYVDGNRDVVTFDRSDSIFFRALAGQLAVTLDRARLADQERARQVQEQQRLRAELQELRRALQQARLIYRSAEMETILTTLRRVAPSDATLLVTGESGTGKELLARTAHELSLRSKKPLVVVDCGAIAPSLIDRELFGHEKGAFTGAERPGAGRLTEADGGTLLLDEIGELPLEVQSKLLRFTQEKVFTPVGGTRTRKIDVRIIAVTNRDLEREVKAGRFRGDLYYRLNVLHLEVPPLRERRADILFLARHFLEKFSLQYQKAVKHLSPAIEEQLERYPWPGNVRELQNRIMQAVLLSESDEIGVLELKLEDDGGAAAIESGPSSPPPAREVETAPVSDGDGGISPGPSGLSPATPEQAWRALAAELGRQIGSIQQTGAPAPLGRWLAEDLILEAHAQTRGVLSRGAELLGIPQTTFRRRYRQADAEAGFTQRSPAWEAIRPRIAKLIRAYDAGSALKERDENLLERARNALLNQIVQRIPAGEVATGAALMGVSHPTYKRWVARYVET